MAAQKSCKIWHTNKIKKSTSKCLKIKLKQEVEDIFFSTFEKETKNLQYDKFDKKNESDEI